MEKYDCLYADETEKSEETTLLVTTSGKWECRARKVGDPLFSSLVPDLPFETIPDRMVLEGSVAELLEKEWQSVVNLLRLMLTVKEEKYLGRPVSFVGTIDRLEWNDWVTLEEVKHSRYILNLPPAWEYYVATDESSEKSERMNHILTASRAVPSRTFFKPSADNLHRVIDIAIHAAMCFANKDGSLSDGSRLVFAHMRNAHILTRLKGYTATDWRLILWKDLYEAIEPLYRTDEQCQGKLMDPTHVLAALRAIGTVSGCYTLLHTSSYFSFSHLEDTPVNELFHFTIGNLPDNVPLHVMGLDAVVYERQSPRSLAYVPVTFIVHHKIGETLSHCSTHEAMAKALLSEYGEKVVSKCASSLLHFAELYSDNSLYKKNVAIALSLATELVDRMA